MGLRNIVETAESGKPGEDPQSRADPPYTQNTQTVYGPETPGGPLALKDDFILVSFFNLANDYENMNDN